MPTALMVTFTNFTPCSSVSIVNFEHVNAEWGGYIVLTITKWSEKCLYGFSDGWLYTWLWHLRLVQLRAQLYKLT